MQVPLCWAKRTGRARRYTVWIANNRFPSTDRGVTFRAGERIRLPFCLYTFPADTVDGLYARLFDTRREFDRDDKPHCVPFSAAYRAIRISTNAATTTQQAATTESVWTGIPCIMTGRPAGSAAVSFPCTFSCAEHGLPHQHALNNLRFLWERLQRESGHLCRCSAKAARSTIPSAA